MLRHNCSARALGCVFSVFGFFILMYICDNIITVLLIDVCVDRGHLNSCQHHWLCVWSVNIHFWANFSCFLLQLFKSTFRNQQWHSTITISIQQQPSTIHNQHSILTITLKISINNTHLRKMHCWFVKYWISITVCMYLLWHECGQININQSTLRYRLVKMKMLMNIIQENAF